MSQLGLWSDATGYKVDRIGKLFAKKGVPVELETLLRFCNESKRQENKDKWALDAYKCAARGQLAQWIQQYIKQIYSNKQKSTSR
uniref:Odorant binding protein 17 n=1 Tax=Liriomyza sativae TaxID=127406 RepID=A0A0X8B2Z5_LIRSA|nr:odorant binding protein 17 [Liriomyza sativae]